MGYDCLSIPQWVINRFTKGKDLQKTISFYKRIRSLREFFRDDVRDVGSPFSRSRISESCLFSDAIEVSDKLLMVPNCTELSENELAKFRDRFEFCDCDSLPFSVHV